MDMSNPSSNHIACTRHVHVTQHDGTVRGANDVTVKKGYHRQNLLHPYMFYAPPPQPSLLLKVQKCNKYSIYWYNIY